MRPSLTISKVFDYLLERWSDGVDTPEDFNYLAVGELIDCVSRRSCGFDELRDTVPVWARELKVADPAFEHSLRILINLAENKFSRQEIDTDWLN